MKTHILFYCLIIFYSLSMIALPLSGNELPPKEKNEERVRVEIEKQHRMEQKAFMEGDCDAVISFYSDEASIFLAGRPVDTQQLLEFCNKVPRPFRGEGAAPEITDNIYVQSENTAYFVRTIDFGPADDDPLSLKREVITKIWSRTNDGWKIVHFHSSVHSVQNQANQN